MPRLKLTVAYEGTAYSGWQLQASAMRGSLSTIQGELEKAVIDILGIRVPVHGSGRTDAGVHAEGQVCHFDVPDEKAGIDWQRALNAKLPGDIRVLATDIVGEDFHARKSARGKVYAYSIWMSAQKPLPRVRNFVWQVPALDMGKVEKASQFFLGSHDFTSFKNAGTPTESSVREIHSIGVKEHTLGPLTCPESWPVFTLFFEGNGFLKQMVRNITGLLIWAGLGKIDVNEVSLLLEAKDRRNLPSPTAPPQGLTLIEVKY